MDHLGLDPSLCGQLTGGYFEAGRMMYVHQPSLVKLKRELKELMASSVVTP